MFKKLILVFAFITFFSSFNFVYADVLINEVQLLPVEGRFLELYNDSDSEVDLTNWYMQRKTATGSSFGSLVSKPNFEGKTIGAHEYFVISRTSISGSDIVLDSLTLTESNTIQIKNSNEEVVDNVSWGSSADCSDPCPPNPGEGESIQKNESGSWVSAVPTPGESNQSSGSSESNNDTENDVDNSNDNTNNTTSTTSTSSSSSSKSSTSAKSKTSTTKPVKQPSMKAKITTNTLAFAGQPIEIQAKITGFYNENVILGRIYWNFGDGSSFEQTNDFSKFYHTYYHPGEYVLFLEYYSKKSQIPEITSKVSIKVVSTSVSISKVGDAKDFFIELTNNASSDIDVSSWLLSADGKTFILPKNTVIMSKKSMTISDKITGFIFNSKPNLNIFSSSGELVFDYQVSNLDSETTETGDEFETDTEALPEEVELLEEMEPVIEEESVLENLSGNVLAGETPEETNSDKSYLFLIGLFVFLTISSAFVYFLRKKSVTSSAVDDFQILNE